MKFTEQQLEAIGLHDLGKDCCIVAGPGSGKTTVLIERFRGLVASGVSPLRILAITFTEKATKQIRERLGAAFADQPDVAEEIRRAWVSTVHGFCSRLLRENAILAGIDPRFRVLNEQEATAMELRATTDALDQFFRDDPERVRALLHSSVAQDLALGMLDVYHAIRAAGTPLGGLDVSPAGARHALDQLGSRCRQLGLPSRFLDRSGAPVSIEDFEDFAALRQIKLTSFRRSDTRYERIKQAIRTEAPAAGLLAAGEFFAPQRATLIEAIVRFDALYRERKAARAALDFSDLEEMSVRLLEENPGTQARIRGQFDHVLMDEFQDTNGLQSRLIALVRPPGGFFAVGDINQSIYGFRYSDPDVFRQYRASIGTDGGRLVELRENWRSRADILDAVTSLVGSAEGVEKHRFRPARSFSRKREPSVEVIRAIGDENLEARWIAARVAELAESAGFGDMAVLVRKADSIAPIAAAFDQAGVPYAVTAAKGFYEAREVADLTHLLRVIANPLDEISFAAVLRSPLAGVSDQDLLRWKHGETPAGIAEFLQELDRWRAARHHVSPDRLLNRAMDRAGYELRLSPRERANVAKFLNQARDAAARQSLDEWIEELARLRETDPREQDSDAEAPEDVVRIMTIHAAKGLEFPIVFLPALQAAGQNRGPALNFSPRLGLGVRWRDPADGEPAKDSLYAAIQAEQKEKQAAEDSRLLYVAMTRAEERLILSCSGKLGQWAAYLESSWNLALDAPWEGAREVALPFPVRIICTNRPPEAPAQLALTLEAQSDARVRLPPAPGQHDSTAAVTSIVLFDDCPRKYYLSRYLGLESAPPGWDSEGEEPDEAPERKDLSATEFGRHVHALLSGGSREGAHPDALDLVDRFEASEPGRRAAAAGRVERELDFLLEIEDVVLRGQIDLWFDDCILDYKTDEVTAAEAPGRSRAYELQLQIYALAIERMTGRAPARAALYYLRPGAEVQVDLDPGALARAGEAVRNFREYQSRNEFPMRVAERCRRCPHYERTCPARIEETGA